MHVTIIRSRTRCHYHWRALHHASWVYALRCTWTAGLQFSAQGSLPHPSSPHTTHCGARGLTLQHCAPCVQRPLGHNAFACFSFPSAKGIRSRSLGCVKDCCGSDPRAGPLPVGTVAATSQGLVFSSYHASLQHAASRGGGRIQGPLATSLHTVVGGGNGYE